ncbi:hypothetical protein K438DRAFT_1842321 [Mycena galopus ATCC 62051]|nr:hypothetical protein K438DRAFT_1842321 [Mycena galopus ATCC 62051]
MLVSNAAMLKKPENSYYLPSYLTYLKIELNSFFFNLCNDQLLVPPIARLFVNCIAVPANYFELQPNYRLYTETTSQLQTLHRNYMLTTHHQQKLGPLCSAT